MASMPLVEALQVVHGLRTTEVVVTTMGSAREWPKFSSHPLDFHYIPSAMGHAPMLALGMALAQPAKEVIAFNGDGCMLMSLGCLVTVVASGAKNYTLIVLNNSRYEVTGGQQTAAAGLPVDFSSVAGNCGFPSVFRFSDLPTWQTSAATALQAPGPRFIELITSPVADPLLTSPGPFPARLTAFSEALQAAT